MNLLNFEQVAAKVALHPERVHEREDAKTAPSAGLSDKNVRNLPGNFYKNVDVHRIEHSPKIGDIFLGFFPKMEETTPGSPRKSNYMFT